MSFNPIKILLILWCGKYFVFQQQNKYFHSCFIHTTVSNTYFVKFVSMDSGKLPTIGKVTNVTYSVTYLTYSVYTVNQDRHMAVPPYVNPGLFPPGIHCMCFRNFVSKIQRHSIMRNLFQKQTIKEMFLKHM